MPINDNDFLMIQTPASSLASRNANALSIDEFRMFCERPEHADRSFELHDGVGPEMPGFALKVDSIFQ